MPWLHGCHPQPPSVLSCHRAGPLLRGARLHSSFPVSWAWGAGTLLPVTLQPHRLTCRLWAADATACVYFLASPEPQVQSGFESVQMRQRFSLMDWPFSGSSQRELRGPVGHPPGQSCPSQPGWERKRLWGRPEAPPPLQLPSDYRGGRTHRGRKVRAVTALQETVHPFTEGI